MGIDLNPEYTQEAKKLIKDKVVLVTGAGGSIGSEIVKQLNILHAKKVICVDRDEYALYRLQLSTTGSALLTDDTLVLADIQNYQSIKNIIATTKPDIVYHAAAVKHLPLLERSPDVAVLTNVMGTENVIRSAVECSVERFVNISTDKAASPSSVLGYTKRLAEMIGKTYSEKGTLISSVRFGNVFASRGSFIETLQWQIANNKPISITHPEMTRYFMSIPQAACLVIEASVLAKSGQTYVLDMGEQYNIHEVVQKYISLSNNPNATIVHTGIRLGEKMYEELYDRSEMSAKTAHPKISSVEVASPDDGFTVKLEQLYHDIRHALIDASHIKDAVKELTLQPEFAQETIVAEKVF